MKTDLTIHSKDNEEAYAKALSEVCGTAETLRDMMFTTAVAENRLLGEILKGAREVVESEAILVNEALDIALNEKSKKLASLNSIIEKVSSESAFVKTALSGIKSKTIEIESLNLNLLKFVDLAEKINSMHQSGALDRIARAVSAMNGEVAK